jgi:hypothetical protein
MTSGFRIDESQFRAWHAAAADRQALRGVAAVAKEMEAALARVADGHVAVTRHQLFTWAETLDGAASRDARAASAGAQLSLPQVVADMRSVLGGRAAPASHAGQAQAQARGQGAPLPYVTRAPAYAPPPAATYAAPMPEVATSTGTFGSVRFVAGHEIPDAVRRVLRDAKDEVRVIAPWQTGMETLVADLVALPPNVKVRLLCRPPAQMDAAYHRALGDLGRRGAVTTLSPHLYTRMVVADRRALVVGAASATASREGALVTSDAAAVAAAAAHFDRLVAEAASGR